MSVTVAPRAHRGECRVAWSVEKSDVPVFASHGIRADVLRDAARLARRDARLADRVHERRLPVIDVAHESHNRCSQFEFVFFLRYFRLLRLLGFFDDRMQLFRLVALLFLENVAVLEADFRRHIGLHRLVDVDENLHVHQVADDLKRLHIHRHREIADDDRWLDVDDFFLALRFAVFGSRAIDRRRGRGFRGRRRSLRLGLGADEF